MSGREFRVVLEGAGGYTGTFTGEVSVGESGVMRLTRLKAIGGEYAPVLRRDLAVDASGGFCPAGNAEVASENDVRETAGGRLRKLSAGEVAERLERVSTDRDILAKQTVELAGDAKVAREDLRIMREAHDEACGAFANARGKRDEFKRLLEIFAECGPDGIWRLKEADAPSPPDAAREEEAEGEAEGPMELSEDLQIGGECANETGHGADAEELFSWSERSAALEAKAVELRAALGASMQACDIWRQDATTLRERVAALEAEVVEERERSSTIAANSTRAHSGWINAEFGLRRAWSEAKHEVTALTADLEREREARDVMRRNYKDTIDALCEQTKGDSERVAALEAEVKTAREDGVAWYVRTVSDVLHCTDCGHRVWLPELADAPAPSDPDFDDMSNPKMVALAVKHFGIDEADVTEEHINTLKEIQSDLGPGPFAAERDEFKRLLERFAECVPDGGWRLRGTYTIREHEEAQRVAQDDAAADAQADRLAKDAALVASMREELGVEK